MIDTRESRNRPARSAPPRASSLGLAVFGLLVAGGLVYAPPLSAAQTGIAVDTFRAEAPRLFRKITFFDTPYLRAALERSQPAEADSNSGDQPAATYARRYGISQDLAQKIVDQARAEGLDPELGFRLVRVESRFKTQAVGPAGALGLTQLMPSTARYVDRSLKTKQDILDPTRNLKIGFRYLRQMIERYDGDVRLGLLAYNRGEVAVDRALRRGADPENGYSHKVLGTKGSNPYMGRGLLSREGTAAKAKAKAR